VETYPLSGTLVDVVGLVVSIYCKCMQMTYSVQDSAGNPEEVVSGGSLGVE